MVEKHLATCAIQAEWSSHRLGTRYLYTFEEVMAHFSQPGFRWRNVAAKEEYFAWLKKPGSIPQEIRFPL